MEYGMQHPIIIFGGDHQSLLLYIGRVSYNQDATLTILQPILADERIDG